MADQPYERTNTGMGAKAHVAGLRYGTGVLLGVLLLIGCGPDRTDISDAAQPPGEAPLDEPAHLPVPSDTLSRQDTQLLLQAEAVVRALASRDWEALAAQSHPQGVRFSPYAFIDSSQALVLSPQEIRRLGTDEEIKTWGRYTDTGTPIYLRFDGYYARFLYDRPFARGVQGPPNTVLRSGNQINNLRRVYPGEANAFVEYHVPGTAARDGLDWSSLRLVFERREQAWYLVALVHDELA